MHTYALIGYVRTNNGLVQQHPMQNRSIEHLSVSKIKLTAIADNRINYGE